MRNQVYASALVLIAILVLAPGASALGKGPAAVAPPQAQEVVIPIEGLDPVLLSQGKEAQGDMKIFVVRGRFQYLFASEETRAAFEKDPSRYEIQYGGACARMGPPYGGNADLYTVHEGRIYVFGSDDCLRAFKESPERYIERDAGPARPRPSQEALKQGRALIEKAVEAVGGAAKLDGVASYEETATYMQRRAQRDVEVKTLLTIAFPDRVRFERVAPDFREVSVVTPSDAFVVGRTVAGLSDASRAHRSRQAKMNLVSILRARNSDGFEAVAVGGGKVGDATVEQVAVTFEGVSLTLGIDPATGRVLSLGYRSRGPGGAFGEVAQAFSDFRPAGGLLLPFKVTATHDGQPFGEQSRSIESIIINGKVLPESFERPKSPAR